MREQSAPPAACDQINARALIYILHPGSSRPPETARGRARAINAPGASWKQTRTQPHKKNTLLPCLPLLALCPNLALSISFFSLRRLFVSRSLAAPSFSSADCTFFCLRGPPQNTPQPPLALKQTSSPLAAAAHGGGGGSGGGDGGLQGPPTAAAAAAAAAAAPAALSPRFLQNLNPLYLCTFCFHAAFSDNAPPSFHPAADEVCTHFPLFCPCNE